jgi:hypothetical protein
LMSGENSLLGCLCTGVFIVEERKIKLEVRPVGCKLRNKGIDRNSRIKL